MAIPPIRGIFTALLLSAIPAFSSIPIINELKIDFTQPIKSKREGTWSENLDISSDGLGWNTTSGASFQSGWFQTRPLATGLSWRPVPTVGVQVLIDPPLRSVQLENGKTITPWLGAVFARYSPDRKHWSSWQALTPTLPTDGTRATNRLFTATLGVPDRERKEYAGLLEAYGELDVDWASDEEAAVKWILQKDPRFFERSLPFIGYVEFLFEAPFYGDQRVTGIQAKVGIGISGATTIPKDPKNKRINDRGPWRFQAP